jgi:hypothetical protein
MEGTEIRKVLGTRAFWGHVGHTGSAFAPAAGTYAGVDAEQIAYTTIADSGPTPAGRRIANLYLLIAAAMYEAAFAVEAGPLSTWSN